MRNYAIAGALLVVMVLVQHFGLERTAEKKLEDRYTRIPDVKASTVLPTYIASLFLGSMRAIVVDALWIELRRMREEEHRYFETREIMEFIAVLQPRNPEVWVQQSQDAAWNIANVEKDKRKKWDWIKTGFKALDSGIKHLPDNAYLKFEVARTLYQKPTISDGYYDWWYLEQVEADDELQAMLQGTPAPKERLSAFQLAIPYLERAAQHVRDLKERNGFKYWTTQTGYNLSLSTLEGYQRICLSHHAQILWRRGKPKEAAEWFRKAAARGREVYLAHRMPIYADYAKVDEACAAVAELDASLPQRDPARVLNELATKVLPWARNVDFDYVRTLAGECRRSIGGDRHEWNDNSSYSTQIWLGPAFEANLAGGDDKDWYLMAIPDPGVPMELQAIVVVLSKQQVPLVVTWYQIEKGQPVEQGTEEIPVGAAKSTAFAVDQPGHYFISVTPKAPLAPGTPSGYTITWKSFGDVGK